MCYGTSKFLWIHRKCFTYTTVADFLGDTAPLVLNPVLGAEDSLQKFGKDNNWLLKEPTRWSRGGGVVWIQPTGGAFVGSEKQSFSRNAISTIRVAM